jgi:hypothetical protein
MPQAAWYDRVKAAADRVKATAEAAWTSPLFASKPLPHSHSFEAALKDADYVPAHLEPIITAHKVSLQVRWWANALVKLPEAPSGSQPYGVGI